MVSESKGIRSLVANDGSLLLQTSFLEWMAYQPENAAYAIVISILCVGLLK